MNKNLLFFLHMLFCISISYAQPVNNDCAGAIELAPSTTGFNFISGSTASATQSLGACSGTANDDVWYKFTATSTEHTITVRPSASFDPTFQLFTACGGTSLGCVNSYGPGAYETKVFSFLTIGTEYVLRVYDWNLAAYEGTKGFEITVQTGNTVAQLPSMIWTWKGGSQTANNAGTYGTKGIGSTSNLPPARYLGANWIENGNLWLFGGFGSSFYNDLWKYDTTAKSWTWVSGDNTTSSRGVYGTQGTASASNKPGARNAIGSWKANNKLWLFGGSGYANASSSGSGYLGDLWQFDLSTQQWTWINGSDNIGSNPVFGTTGTPSSSNTPGGKTGISTWTDASGNLWLFGGLGYFTTSVSSEGYSNDLWKFDVVTNQWTHIKGSKTKSSAGTYGTKGVSNINNLPKARAYGHTWVDNNGDFWLFGGETAFQVVANDVWKYNVANNEWTWMGGDNGSSTINVYYGIKGVESSATNPGGRRYGITHKDNLGNLWYIAGHRINTSGGNTRYMDIFLLNPTTGNFKWMYGNGDCCASANYGTLNVPNASNNPGARFGSYSYSDNNGNLWLFGGSTTSPLSDLWFIQGLNKPSAPANTTGLNALSICAENATTLTATGSGKLGWYSSATGGTYLGGGNTLTTPILNSTTEYYVQDSTWTSSETRTKITVNVTPIPVVTISGTSTICKGQETTLTANGADTYQWVDGPSTSTYSVNPATTTTYFVNGVSGNNCTSEVATVSITVNELPEVNSSASETKVCKNSPLVILSGIPTGGTFSGTAVTGSNFDPSMADAGDVLITYTYQDENGCINSDITTINVYELPVVTITASENDICHNAALVSLQGSPIGGTFTGTAVSSSTFDPTTSGEGSFIVSYTYEDNNGCINSDQTTLKVDICTGLNNPSKNIISNNIYPNPANDYLVINSSEGSTLKISKTDGVEVLEKTISEGENTIPLSTLPQGFYLIRIEGPNKTMFEKLTIVK